MTPGEIREEILDILENIAPDEDMSDLKDDLAFREQLELDSMDFPGYRDGVAKSDIESRYLKRITRSWQAWTAP